MPEIWVGCYDAVRNMYKIDLLKNICEENRLEQNTGIPGGLSPVIFGTSKEEAEAGLSKIREEKHDEFIFFRDALMDVLKDKSADNVQVLLEFNVKDCEFMTDTYLKDVLSLIPANADNDIPAPAVEFTPIFAAYKRIRNSGLKPEEAIDETADLVFALFERLWTSIAEDVYNNVTPEGEYLS